jgi:hypothetical protein
MPKEAAYVGGPGMMIFQSVGRRQDRAPFTSRAPWALDDAKLTIGMADEAFYFQDLDGHILELMTVPQ